MPLINFTWKLKRDGWLIDLPWRTITVMDCLKVFQKAKTFTTGFSELTLDTANLGDSDRRKDLWENFTPRRRPACFTCRLTICSMKWRTGLKKPALKKWRDTFKGWTVFTELLVRRGETAKHWVDLTKHNYLDFDLDGKPDNISFMIKRIKVHSQEALKDPTYRFPGNYGVEKFLEIFSGE